MPADSDMSSYNKKTMTLSTHCYDDADARKCPTIEAACGVATRELQTVLGDRGLETLHGNPLVEAFLDLI